LVTNRMAEPIAHEISATTSASTPCRNTSAKFRPFCLLRSRVKVIDASHNCHENAAGKQNVCSSRLDDKKGSSSLSLEPIQYDL
jgi:hypothetical protein